MKARWSRFLRLGVIFGLALLAVCLPVAIQKAPRIVDRATRFKQAVEHVIKWKLNPGPTVAVAKEAPVQPLPLLRSALITAPLRVSATNPRYFSDGSGKIIYLTGSHTWQSLQDSGSSTPLPAFGYTAYLDFLEANHHNFFRLWAWEQPRWSLDSPNPNFRFVPHVYQRPGPELAADGLPKFDLTQFNQAYFDRMQQRIIEAKGRGIYVSVMLFNGWSVAKQKGNLESSQNPWQSHPFNRANNINNIDGDLNQDDSGEEIHELVVPEITALQEAYVRKVIDTVNDLDNVLYEISNESHGGSYDWQNHMIQLIKTYEAQKPKQHPVGMTVQFPDGDNSKLLASNADWVSLNGYIDNPPIANGTKIVLADTDHLCGICGDRQWVWKSFTRGENPVFMDVYDGRFDLIIPPLPADPLRHAAWVSVRHNLGYSLTYANRLNLAAMEPRADLASTGYCLANPAEKNAEYLVYLPSGGQAVVDLSATPGELAVEWFNPANGTMIMGTPTVGGGNRSFISPFETDAVLYLKANSKISSRSIRLRHSFKASFHVGASLKSSITS